jgi:uncharacterized protein YndB with AHSA1/START domain
MVTSTDRIEKRIVLRAPQERVWRAISNAKEFGAWFGVELDGEFASGRHVRGRTVPTAADPEIAKTQERYAGIPMEFFIEHVHPMTTLSFRWHPFAIDTTVDYSSEPMTLVTFTLERAGNDTALTIVESGFDSIPLARRADAFEANDEGWAMMTELIEKYLARS